MDDTIENFCQTLVDTLNETHGLSVSMDDITEWDLSTAFPMLTRNQIFAPTYTKDFWKRVTPLLGAIENLWKITEDGHTVVIVTASAPESVPLKLNNFLFKYFPFIKRKNVIIASNKQMIKGDIMVDDAPHNLIGGDYEKVMMTANHNRSFDAEAHGITRVRSWDEAYQFIDKFARS